MSLSTDAEYLARMGVKAEGGPLDGQYVDDNALLWRTRGVDGGWYRLTGKADGSLVYTFEPITSNLAAIDTRPS